MATGAAKATLQAPKAAVGTITSLQSHVPSHNLATISRSCSSSSFKSSIRLPHRTLRQSVQAVRCRQEPCIPASRGVQRCVQPPSRTRAIQTRVLLRSPVRYGSVRCSVQTERKRHDTDRLWVAPNGVKHSIVHDDVATPLLLHSDSPHPETDDELTIESSLSLTPRSEPADVAAEKADVAADVEPESGGELISNETAVGGTLAAGALIISVVASLALLSYYFKDDISNAVDYFTTYIEGAGSTGYVAFVLGYAALEVLAVPAIPLTLSAGVLFGPVMGTFLCSLSGTISATIAFLIARYVARDKILSMVKGNKKYEAIDRAVGDKSFRIVTLLRLSPLMPFSLGNYFYGLTSVKLLPYIAGTWIGMIPGTWAYVSAGAFGRSLLEAENGSSLLGDSSLWSLVGGVALTAFAATYITKIVQDAVKDAE